MRDELQRLHPGLEVEIVVIQTKGDKLLDAPLARIGDKGLFTKELETAMLEGRTDLSVHSAKDMPTAIPDGLELVAFTAREDVRDVFVGRRSARAPRRRSRRSAQGAVVGTSSLRRRSQLLALRPDLDLVDIRGNVQTRLRKLEEQGMAGTILAAAGLARLGQPELAAFAFSFEQMLPAVGPGRHWPSRRGPATRACARSSARSIHEPTSARRAGRARLMRALEGGCQVPIAGHAELTAMPGAPGARQLRLRAYVGSLDGADALRGEQTGPGRGAGGAGDGPRRASCWSAAPDASSRRSAADDGDGRRVGRARPGACRWPGRPSSSPVRREQAASLADPLAALGADVILAPTIRIVPRPLDDEVVRIVRQRTAGATS